VIKLYRIRYSTNVERVTLALAHKGLEFESSWIEPDDRSAVAELGKAEPDDARVTELLGAQMRSWLDWFEALLDGRHYLLGDLLGRRLCRVSVPQVRRQP
jgi:hypothetical protein